MILTPQITQSQQKAKNFNIKVSLNDLQLKITLKNYNQQTIYEKQYTNDHSDNQIHSRVQIFDIFTLLSQKSCSVKRNNVYQKLTKSLIYQYGQIIYKDEVPCYKIEENGKIIVFMSLTNKISKQQILYESKLNLNKIGNINLEELNNNQKITNQILQKQLYNLKQQNMEIKQQILQIRKQNSQLKKQNKSMKEDIENLKKLIEYRQQNNNKTQLTKNITKPKNQFTQLKTGLIQPYQYTFKIQNNKLQYVHDRAWTQYIFNNSISLNEIYKFKIKILRNVQRQMMIGIIDVNQMISHRYSHDKKNTPAYQSHGGYKYPNGEAQGGGFQAGDIVQTTVDRKNNSIIWQIYKGSTNIKFKASSNTLILNQNSQYYPYIQFLSTNDAVEFY